MSLEEAATFINKIGRSPELQAKVNTFKGRGVLDRLVALGAENGHHFTVAEYRKAVVSMANGALSQASLDEVLRETGLKS